MLGAASPALSSTAYLKLLMSKSFLSLDTENTKPFAIAIVVMLEIDVGGGMVLVVSNARCCVVRISALVDLHS